MRTNSPPIMIDKKEDLRVVNKANRERQLSAKIGPLVDR